MSVLPLPSPLTFAAERPVDAAAVEALIARAFGPGRYVKAAERLRETNAPVLDLSFVAWMDGALVGCVRLWPIKIEDAPALLLGPFAVDEACRSQGLGASLIERACAAAQPAGHALILLVGDPAYFSPLGFSAGPARQLIMPGPVDQKRVMVRALAPGAADALVGIVAA